jgi:hypothetical protein
MITTSPCAAPLKRAQTARPPSSTAARLRLGVPTRSGVLAGRTDRAASAAAWAPVSAAGEFVIVVMRW